MRGVDRNEVLDRIDLAELADELLGGRRGHGSGAKWPSPVPDHPQTGQSPPMSIFTTSAGQERWTCFATGASGTAIDLVQLRSNMTYGETLEFLAQRAGIAAEHSLPPVKVRPVNVVRPVGDPDPALGEWVQACAELLWTPAADQARQYLTGRGLNEATLKQNLIGWDPGHRVLPRKGGIPKRGNAVVFPVLNQDGAVTYAQSRSLRAGATPKYVNPKAAIAQHPYLSHHHTTALSDSGLLVVAEGIPDALMANQAGFDSVACIGVGVASRAGIAEQIRERANGRKVAVCFDADDKLRTGVVVAEALTGRLKELEVKGWNVTPPSGHDLSNWLVECPEGLRTSLGTAPKSRGSQEHQYRRKRRPDREHRLSRQGLERA